MRLSVRRVARILKTSGESFERKVSNWRTDRKGPRFEYFAIHDGRTLNACADLDTGTVHLVLDGPVSVALPPSVVEHLRREWVVDLLSLELPLGAYTLTGGDGAGATYAMYPPPGAVVLSDEPAIDAKVVDVDSHTAVVTTASGSVGVEIRGGDDCPRLAALNYFGPDAFKVHVPSVGALQHIVATERETGEAVDIGELVDGIGIVQITALASPGVRDESRWDVTLRDDTGTLSKLFGPAIDYRRPDQATSFGDISFIEAGTLRRWKPYVARDGGLAVRVTSERKEGAL
jgi:hypothetical protein